MRDGEGGCCPRCHFRWEERVMFPLLPPWLRDLMGREHERILGLPPEARMPRLLVHAEIEEKLCGPYLPASVKRELEAQHERHEEWKR